MKKLIFALVFAVSSNVFASSWQKGSDAVNASQIVSMDDVESSDGVVAVRVVSLLSDAQGIYKIVVYIGDKAFESSGYASTAGEFSFEKKDGAYQLKMLATEITDVNAQGEWSLADTELSMNLVIDAEGNAVLK